MRRSVSLALVLATGASVAPSLEEPPSFPSQLTIVSLPVFVTGGDGRSLPGLAEADFEVLDDGKPVSLAGFRAIDAGDAASAAALRESPAARRQFLLLFDLSFTAVDSLVRSRRAAMAFVRNGLEPSDLVAVATVSANHGLRLLVSFTSDRVELQRAIETLGVLQLDRQADPLGLAFDLRELGSLAADTPVQERSGPFDEALRAQQIRFQQSEAENYRRRVLVLVEAFAQLGRALDAVQGRKQIVFLSNGFDESVLTGSQGVEAARDSEAIVRGRVWEVPSSRYFGDSDVRDELGKALRGFSASDAIVHAVDLRGLSAHGDVRYQSAETAVRSGSESLSQIASLSGGRFFRNTNDLGQVLLEVAEASRHYYLLAFEPPDPKGPGKFHRLKVRVKPKASVSHRSGYYERDPGPPALALARRFEAAEVVAKGLVLDEVPFDALAMPYRPQDGKVVLPVVLELDVERLLPPASSSAELQVFGYALDEHGAVQDVATFFSRLDTARLTRIREGGLQCHLVFTLQPGRYSLRLLVQEGASGRSGSRVLEISVPAFAADEVVLAPPLLMDDEARWVVLQVSSAGTEVPVKPFRVSDPFVPRVRARLANGRTERVCVLAFDGGRRYDPGAQFQLTPRLLDSNGQPHPVGQVVLAEYVADDEGFRRFVLRITPKDLPPGRYTLRVALQDPSSGRVTQAHQMVQVEAP